MGIAPWYPRTKVPAHQAHLIGKPGTQLPITKIWNQLQANNAHAVARPKYAVLTFSGSFNPVHSSHLAAMTEASNVLTADGYTVLGGFIAPSSELYVNKKLGAQAMPLNCRVAMVKEACKGTPWEALDWGWASSPKIKSKVNQYLQKWCQGLPIGPISIETYEVGGADYVSKSLSNYRYDLLTPYTVCVGRGTDTQKVKDKSDIIDQIPNFYVSDSNVPAASSTIIRSLLAQKDWTALINLYYMYPGVLHLMQQLFDADKLFINGNDQFLKNVPAGGFSVGEKVYRLKDSKADSFFQKGMVGIVKAARDNKTLWVSYPGRPDDWNSISSIRSVNSLARCVCGCGNPVHPPDSRGSYNVCCRECTHNNGHDAKCYHRSAKTACICGCGRPANGDWFDCCPECKRDGHATWCNPI